MHRLLLVIAALAPLLAAEYYAPAGTRSAIRRPGASSILPGGRIVQSLGHQHTTGPGPFGVAVSPDGKTVVSANGGPDRYSLTVLEKDKKGPWKVRHLVAPRASKDDKDTDNDDAWRSVFMGVAFATERTVFASEGNSGCVRLLDAGTGSRKKIFDLNQGGFEDSYSADLAYDATRNVLYVVDQANFRLVAIDARKHAILSSTRLGRLPFSIALSPDRNHAYITNVGMFEYQALPGVDPKQPRETGLPFPAFGFPSAESRTGVRRDTQRGPVDVPGLGDPNVREANSLCIVDASDPAAPKVEAFVPTGLPLGRDSVGGSSPSGVLATEDRVFVSNAHNDTITVIDAKTHAVTGEIPIRIPGLGYLRGVLPIGMAFHAASKWLLVAEAGINAVGVIDVEKLQVVGHLPVGWFPTRVVVDRDNVYVTNARGQGVGPNIDRYSAEGDSFVGTLRRGSISVFPLPDAAELSGHTGVVLDANGFRPRVKPPADLQPAATPPPVKHVVLIVKENRTYDEVFGDIVIAANGRAAGLPQLARFGRNGYVSGGDRLSLQKVNVTPNHHEMAQRWAFSDNFYADSDVSVDGHHWLVGSYPNAWTQSTWMAAYGGQKDFRLPTKAPGRLLFAGSNSSVHPEEQLEAGTLWHHLERNGISFRNYGEGFELAGAGEGPGLKPTGARFLTNVPMPDPLYRNTSRDYPNFNMNIPDQFRADRFIAEMEARHVKGSAPFPQFIFIHLPNDHMAKPRAADGFPFEASYVADNDYALGRIVEYLSKSKWWRDMAIFVTEDDAQGGRDHIDAHRTVLLAMGPYLKRNYVSHANSSFPGLLKTIFRLLNMPALNLFDAVATDLSDCFTTEPDFSTYTVLPEDPRLFDPKRAKEPMDAEPSIRMDDPNVIREQHRR